MGGGLAGHGELAAAVFGRGGPGTIGIVTPDALAVEIAAARGAVSALGRPLAVNRLLPFARRAHQRRSRASAVVVTFWGRPRRRTSAVWIHLQCGSVEEALAARDAGADAVIAQGVEAGAHAVRGTTLRTVAARAHARSVGGE